MTFTALSFLRLIHYWFFIWGGNVSLTIRNSIVLKIILLWLFYFYSPMHGRLNMNILFTPGDWHNLPISSTLYPSWITAISVISWNRFKTKWCLNCFIMSALKSPIHGNAPWGLLLIFFDLTISKNKIFFTRLCSATLRCISLIEKKKKQDVFPGKALS